MMWGGMLFMWFFGVAIIMAAIFLIAYVVNPRQLPATAKEATTSVITSAQAT